MSLPGISREGTCLERSKAVTRGGEVLENLIKILGEEEYESVEKRGKADNKQNKNFGG